MKTDLTYDEFCTAYRDAFRSMLKYKLGEIGSKEYCDKMAALADDYPEFLVRFEEEEENY